LFIDVDFVEKVMGTEADAVPADYGDSLMTVAQFGVRYRHIYPQDSRLRWLLRDRLTNGLVTCGAVVQVYANGDKPNLFLHPPSWFQWMRAGGRHGAGKAV
jgi:hypothetical protein